MGSVSKVKILDAVASPNGNPPTDKVSFAKQSVKLMTMLNNRNMRITIKLLLSKLLS